jgi:hypothetical protein
VLALGVAAVRKSIFPALGIIIATGLGLAFLA